MQLERINCPICNSGNYSLVFQAEDFRLKLSRDIFNVVKCDECSFIFLNPRPAKSEFIHFYPSDFHKEDRRLFYKIIEPCFKLAQRSTIKIFKEFKKNGKLLDVGCGNGNFMLSMQKIGYDVWGVELNPEARKYTPDILRDRVFYKDIKECKFPSKTFDIVTMFQSLEHIHDLNELFTELSRIAKDNAILYICVPNMEFFEFRIFGPYAYNLEVPRHLYFFTRKSLRRLLEKKEFKEVRFIRNNLFESVCTPAAFYHSLINFLSDKGIVINRVLQALIFIPVVLLRLIIRIVFFFDDQNLKAVCSRKCI